MMSYSWQPLSSSPFRKVHSVSSKTLTRNPGFPGIEVSCQDWSRSSLKHSALSATRGYNSPAHRPSENVELSQSNIFNEDHNVSSINEKELMQGLNDRFAGYLDKVRQLEQQNKGLEAEIIDLRQKQTISCNPNIYEPEISELRNLIQEIENQKMQIHLDRDHLEEDLQQLKGKYEKEAQVRHDIEASIQAYKRDSDNAHLIKLELERKAQSIMDEIMFLKNSHEEEVADLFSQIQDSQVSVEMKEFMKPDLTAALREIRAQMEGYTNVNMQQKEEWFTSRVAKLNDAAEINKEALQNTRQEINEYNRQLQSKNIELETVRGRKESLEKQLNDIEDRHDGELIRCQDTFQQLENELKNTKQEMTHHLREYQDLLNVKMALDVEIASYRKLLEGEETRFGSVTGSFSPPSYTYRQPQYMTQSSYMTTKTKATPKYKLVEGIISETTKEVDMAELEDAYMKLEPGKVYDEKKTKNEKGEVAKSEEGTAASDEGVEETTDTKDKAGEKAATEAKEEEEAPEDKEKEEAAEDKEKEEAAEDKEKEEAPEDKEKEEAAEDKEKEEAAEDKEKEEAAEDKEKEEAVEDEEKEEAPEDKEKEEAPEDKEKEEAPEDKEKEEAAEDKEKEEAPEDKEKEEAPEDKEKEEAPEGKGEREPAKAKGEGEAGETQVEGEAAEAKEEEEAVQVKEKASEEGAIEANGEAVKGEAAKAKEEIMEEQVVETKQGATEEETDKTKEEAVEEEATETKGEPESSTEAATQEGKTESGNSTVEEIVKGQGKESEPEESTKTSHDKSESAAEEKADGSKDKK